MPKVPESPLLTRLPQERFYHPELDMLRFASFTLIFVHHSMPHVPDAYSKMGVGTFLSTILCALGSAGAFGVELFFLLSAYLVTELLLRERALRGQVDLKSFYIRRGLRIWPLYLFFLALAWSMQWWVPGQHIGWRAMLAFLALCGNWWIVFVGFPSSVIFPLWFISLQEQFYLFWPAWMRRLQLKGLLLSVAGLIAAATAAHWYQGEQHSWESKIWTNTFTHLDALGMGILLAVLLGGQAPKLRNLHRVALFAGGAACFLLAGSYFRIKADPLTTDRIVLGYPVAVVGAMALFLATLRPQTNSVPSRLAQVFIYLGNISFGLYVFHVLGLMISDYTVSHQDSSLGRYLFHNLVAFAVTVVLASISYRWLEKPFLGLKKRFSRVASRPA